MTPRATCACSSIGASPSTTPSALVPYLAALGISHLYASPIMTARAGSMHGYDVIDPTRGQSGAGRRSRPAPPGRGAARRRTGPDRRHRAEPYGGRSDNRWWLDVLKHGRASRYAASFDIDWRRGRRQGPAAVLGKPLQEALKAGEIAVVSDRRRRTGAALLHRMLLPLAGEAATGEDLATVLERQHYRLAWWRLANDDINWRRFFDINELVCLRMENDDTFDAIHALILRLYGEGLIDGVRVDHVDGLREPDAYCRRLRAALEAAGRGRRPYLVVEKILLRGEALPAAWGCDGTTGYDFMDEVNAVQHDGRGERALAQAWATVSGRPAAFAPEEEAARREILARSFSAQLDACVAALHPSLQRLLGGDLASPDAAPGADRAAGALSRLSHLRHRRRSRRRRKDPVGQCHRAAHADLPRHRPLGCRYSCIAGCARRPTRQSTAFSN